MAILVYQTIPVGDEHFCHLKLSFVPINWHSWSPLDWKVPVPFGGAPFRNLEGLLHPIRARQIWEKIIVIAKCHNKEYLFTHSSAQICIWIALIPAASRGRKFYFRARVNNNLKSERHGYLLHLNRWDNLVLWTYSPNLWLTVTAVQDS